MLRWFKTWIYNEDIALEKIAELFPDSENAFTCLKEIQRHHVISGSSVMYGETQISDSDSISNIDIFVLNHHNYMEVVNVIKKHYENIVYSIEYDALENIEKNKKSKSLNVIINYNGCKLKKINYRIVETEGRSARDILLMADFDYICAAIYKDTLYLGEHTRKAWENCRILYNLNGIFSTARLEKMLQKNYKTVLFETSSDENNSEKEMNTENNTENTENNGEEKYIEIVNLEGVQLEKNKILNGKLYGMNFKIVDILPTKNYKLDKYANCIENAYFILQNETGNTISCNSVVANISNIKDIIIPNELTETSNIAWVKAIISKKYPKSKVKYLVEKFIHDPIMIKNIITFSLPCICIENSEADIVNCYLSLLQNSDNMNKWNYFKKLYFTMNMSIPEISQRLFQYKNLNIKTMRHLVLCIENLNV